MILTMMDKTIWPRYKNSRKENELRKWECKVEVKCVKVTIHLKNTFIFYLLFYKNMKSFKSFLFNNNNCYYYYYLNRPTCQD